MPKIIVILLVGSAANLSGSWIIQLAAMGVIAGCARAYLRDERAKYVYAPAGVAETWETVRAARLARLAAMAGK
jgi:hypothetical protein